MKRSLATKTLATLLIVTALSVAIVSGGDTSVNAATTARNEARLEKLQQHHDRKLNLRASVLGVTPVELKTELKTQDFTTVIKKHGFKDIAAFHVALLGKLKTELKQRGWTDSKISAFIEKQQARFKEKSKITA